MTKIYATDSFLTDLSPDLSRFTNKIKKRIVKLSAKTTNSIFGSNIEVFIVEIILQIPVFIYILYLGFIISVALVNTMEPEKGYAIRSVLSNSMTPSIKPGSLVILEPPRSLVVGDIVSYKEVSSISGNTTGRTLIHRIIKEVDSSSREYITKGDSNIQPDPQYVNISNIYGKVLWIIPYLGYISYISLTPWGLILFLLIPSIVLTYSEIKLFKKYIRP